MLLPTELTSTDPPLRRTRRHVIVARIARYCTAGLLICLFIATHYPTPYLPHSVAAADKIAHCLAYFALAFSALVSWDLAIGPLRPQHYFTVWLVGTLYGAFDEVTQIPVGRHCDLHDWLFDILGIVLGLTAFRLLRPTLSRLLRMFKLGVVLN